MTKPQTIQYRESLRTNFGKLRILHLDDLSSIETQVIVNDEDITYGMRLGWRQGEPPLTGELISLHLTHSKVPMRITRVHRTCVCCVTGIVYIYAEPIPNVLPDLNVCDCVKKRKMGKGGAWRSLDSETVCPRKNRMELRRISNVMSGMGKK